MSELEYCCWEHWDRLTELRIIRLRVWFFPVDLGQTDWNVELTELVLLHTNENKHHDRGRTA